MPQQRYYLAIDIGASSGRHVLGSVNGNGVIELEEVHRFDNAQGRRRASALRTRIGSPPHRGLNIAIHPR